jgi:hypothetical protein
MQRLLLMAQLTRGCGHLTGGAMTVAIARQEEHGDPAVCAYVHRLLKEACTPLFGMTREWLLHGELTDAYDEVRHAHPAATHIPLPRASRCHAPPPRR